MSPRPARDRLHLPGGSSCGSLLPGHHPRTQYLGHPSNKHPTQGQGQDRGTSVHWAGISQGMGQQEETTSWEGVELDPLRTRSP